MNAINPSELWKKRLGDWVVNPYVGCMHGCKFCYCPAMPGVKFFNGKRAQSEWGEYVIPKEGIVSACASQLTRFTPDKAKRTEWGDGWILMSFLTDAYQPIEGKERLTQKCLKMILEAGHKVRIQTRGVLVRRDFDMLREHGDRVLLGTSLPSMNEEVTRVMEPKAASLKARWKMLSEASELGIPVYVALAPVMPWTGENEMRALIAMCKTLPMREVFCEVLNPKGSNLEMVIKALADANFMQAASSASRYDSVRWAAMTSAVLLYGKENHPHFIPWPDTMRAWKKHIHPKDAAWLEQFLPPNPENP